MAKIPLTSLDKYIEEPYSKWNGKPKGTELCGFCNQAYEPLCIDEETGFTVCANCTEVSFTYEEEP